MQSWGYWDSNIQNSGSYHGHVAFKHFSGVMCKFSRDFLQSWSAEGLRMQSIQLLADALPDVPGAPEQVQI